MSEFSNRIKAKADLAQIVGEAVALRPGGNGFIGLCPFHAEKTPSFHVHAAKQFYYCFGCHAHGDIFAFLMQLRQISFSEAVEAVAERLGIEVPRAGEEDGGASGQERRELLRLHAAAVEFYQQCWSGREGVAARAYLQAREFPPQVADRFQLGFAPDSGRALSLWLERQGYAVPLALRSGLCQLRRERAGEAAPASPVSNLAWADLYDRFRNRLLFPIADSRGRAIAFGGRALDPADGKTPKYLNSPETPLYTKGRILYNFDRASTAIRDLGYAILVEGYFDCLRVFCAGFENVVASCGTALTSAQLAPLARLTQKVAVNFDPDTAGAAAAERSIGVLLEEGFQMRIVELEGGLDPDLFIRRQGREAYAAALKSSRSFFDYLAQRARGRFDLRRAEGKIAALNHLLPYLAHVHDPILRQEVAEQCASQLGLEASLLSRQLLQAARQRRAQLPAAATTAATAELLSAERVLLRAWLEWEPRRAELEGVLPDLLEGLASATLFDRLRPQPDLDWQTLAAQLPEADRQLLAELWLMEELLTTELVDSSLAALRQRRALAQARQLQSQIQLAAAAGDRPRLEALLRQKTALDSQHPRPAHKPDSGTGPAS